MRLMLAVLVLTWPLLVAIGVALSQPDFVQNSPAIDPADRPEKTGAPSPDQTTEDSDNNDPSDSLPCTTIGNVTVCADGGR